MTSSWEPTPLDHSTHLRVVPLSSPNGQVLLHEITSSDNNPLHDHCSYEAIQPFFVTQIHSSTCSVVSTSIAFNTLLGTTIYKEEDVFDIPHVKKVVNAKLVKMNGMTLYEQDRMAKEMAKIHNFTVTTKYAQDFNEDVFRTDLKHFLQNPKGAIMVVNYLPVVLINQEDFPGHFSVIAAYHQQSDSVLLLDVWPTNPHLWVKTSDMWKAMNTKDFDSKKSRGWQIVVKNE